MNYIAHFIVTLLLTIAAVIVGMVLAAFAGMKLLAHGYTWPLPVLVIIAVAAGMYLPTWVMGLIPVHCPKCGGEARLTYLGMKSHNSLIPKPAFGYRCMACKWTTARNYAR